MIGSIDKRVSFISVTVDRKHVKCGNVEHPSLDFMSGGGIRSGVFLLVSQKHHKTGYIAFMDRLDQFQNKRYTILISIKNEINETHTHNRRNQRVKNTEQ